MSNQRKLKRRLWEGEVFSNKYREDRQGNNLVVIKDSGDGIVDVWFENPNDDMTVRNGLAIKGTIARRKLMPDSIDGVPVKVFKFSTPFDQRFFKGTHCYAYVGGFKYTRKNCKKIYKKWMSMLERCFTSGSQILELQRLQRTYPKSQLIQMGYLINDAGGVKWNFAKIDKDAGQYRSYQDVLVSSEFANFQKFAEWCISQPGHDKKGWHLDKDLLSKPNDRMYSPETCCFLPAAINIALRNRVRNANKIRQLAEFHKDELSPLVYEALLKIDSNQ